MFSCTRPYVDTKEALMGQGRRNMLLRLLKQLLYNTRGNNSLFIIITSKYGKETSRKSEKNHPKRQKTGSEVHFSALYVIIEVYPTPFWTYHLHPTPPPNIRHLPCPSSFKYPSPHPFRFILLLLCF